MEVDKRIDFKKDDLIYKVFFETKNGVIIKTVDTIIYKIINIQNEYYGSSLEKYVSRDIALIVPKDKDSIDFGEVWVIQTILDGKIHVYAKHI